MNENPAVQTAGFFVGGTKSVELQTKQFKVAHQAQIRGQRRLSAIEFDEKELPTKLPLWRTIGISYAEWFRHFPDVMRATAFWIVLLAITMGGADWLQWSMAVSTVADLKAGAPKNPGLRLLVARGLYVFSATVLVVAVVDVAVSWHRRVILNEAAALLRRNIGSLYYWRYFAKLLVACAVAATPLLLLFGLIARDIDVEVPIAINVAVPAAGMLILFAVFGIFARLSLVLPPEACSRAGLACSKSWQLTRGNTWRFVIGLFVCGIAPGYLIAAPLEWVGLIAPEISAVEILITAGEPDAWIKGAIRRQILIAGALVTLPIGVGFLSHFYLHRMRQ